jgi:hypothetical protein
MKQSKPHENSYKEVVDFSTLDSLLHTIGSSVFFIESSRGINSLLAPLRLKKNNVFSVRAYRAVLCIEP